VGVEIDVYDSAKSWKSRPREMNPETSPNCFDFAAAGIGDIPLVNSLLPQREGSYFDVKSLAETGVLRAVLGSMTRLLYANLLAMAKEVD